MKNFLEILLRDQTTGKHILWANDEFGAKEIQPAQIDLIEPRWKKNRELQKLRTKTRAEIFTPPEVCELQNDLVCKPFDKRTPWRDFINAKFLEITCGEAPYLVNRYNAVTGDAIPLDNRVGLLDRKFHVVNSETKTQPGWMSSAIQALQSVYGYEFQGDNLFLARRNVFDTVKDFFRAKFNREPPEDFLIAVATIISCNLWQMDGLTGAIPYANTNRQGTLSFGNEPDKPQEDVYCKILDWQTRKLVEFKSLSKGGRR